MTIRGAVHRAWVFALTLILGVVSAPGISRLSASEGRGTTVARPSCCSYDHSTVWPVDAFDMVGAPRFGAPGQRFPGFVRSGADQAWGISTTPSVRSFVATNNLPYQIHHFATDKNSTYTPAMAAIASKYGLTVGGAWNRESLPHNGRHPNEYHDFVLQNMQKADTEAAGNQARFLELFERYVKDPVRRNPDLLRKCGWS